jgi:hypothetical protein
VSTPSTTVTLPATALACQGLFPFGKREAEAEPEAEPEAEAAALEKRQGALGLLAAGQITAGCKCLNLAPRTSTSRVTPTPTVRPVPQASFDLQTRALTIGRSIKPFSDLLQRLVCRRHNRKGRERNDGGRLALRVNTKGYYECMAGIS